MVVPEVAALIDAVRPDWVVWENVPGLLTRGLHIVHADLVRLGYRHRVGWASACAVGAPHARRRLFGLAHAAGLGRHPRRVEPGSGGPPQGEEQQRPTTGRSAGWATEPAVGRVAYGVPDRVDRCAALGNAVVPAVAEHVGRLITEFTGAAALTAADATTGREAA